VGFLGVGRKLSALGDTDTPRDARTHRCENRQTFRDLCEAGKEGRTEDAAHPVAVALAYVGLGSVTCANLCARISAGHGVDIGPENVPHP